MDLELMNALQDAQYLSAVNAGESDKKYWKKHRKLPKLPQPLECQELKEKMEKEGELSFEKIYKQPIGKELFRQYAMTKIPKLAERATVMFEVQVETYRRNPRTLRESIAKDIYKMFISEESEAVIAVPEDIHAKIKTTIFETQVFDMDLFDELQSLNAARLENAHFSSFLQSNYFERFIQWKKLETIPVEGSQFLLYRVLGRGGFGEVNACQKRDSGQMYAVKMLDKKRVKNNGDVTAFNERTILAQVDSRFVVGLKYAFHTKRHLSLVLDLLQGGDLQFHLMQAGRFKEDRAKFYLAHILCAISDLHEAGIVYRDLKPENVLLDDRGFLKVSDLGLATDFKRAIKSKGKVGTPGYLAPEMIEGKRHGYCVDWWSFGCCMFKMLTGRSPFRSPDDGDNSIEGIYRRTKEKELTFLPKYFTPDAADLCSRLLERDVTKRIGCGGFDNAHGAQEIKDHPWFVDFPWEDLIHGHIQEAPFVPSKYHVNAESLGEMKQMATVKNVKITAEDEASYEKFPIVIGKAWQMEMLESGVFHEVNHLTDHVHQRRLSAESFKRIKAVSRKSSSKELISDPMLSSPKESVSENVEVSDDEASLATI